MCSRFARTIDFLIRKVFRTIDACEFEHQGTLIDVVNNAHKRKLFNSMDLIRNIKDLRNEIVHEYIEDDLITLFAEAKTLTAELIIIVQNTLDYGKRLLANETQENQQLNSIADERLNDGQPFIQFSLNDQ